MSVVAEINPLDSDSVMDEIGDAVPIILREAMDSGFDDFRRHRDREPGPFVRYSPTTLAGMLTDSIYPYVASLAHLVDPEQAFLQTRRTSNDRATELFVGADFYIKVKRRKDKRRKATPKDGVEVDGMMGLEYWEEGIPKNFPTRRVGRQFAPLSTSGPQMVFPFAPVHSPGDEYDRWCLFAGFDIGLVRGMPRAPAHRVIRTKAEPLVALATRAGIGRYRANIPRLGRPGEPSSPSTAGVTWLINRTTSNCIRSAMRSHRIQALPGLFAAASSIQRC